MEAKNLDQNITGNGNNISNNNRHNNKNSNNKSIGYVIQPYIQGLEESFKNIFGKYGIQTYFKGNSTLKNILNIFVSPKHNDHMEYKSGNFSW